MDADSVPDLMHLWKARLEQTRTTLNEVRSSVEADLALLTDTRLSAIADSAGYMI